MELHKLQILAGQTSPGHHCISISGTSVSRCATEVGSSITSVRKESTDLNINLHPPPQKKNVYCCLLYIVNELVIRSGDFKEGPTQWQ